MDSSLAPGGQAIDEEEEQAVLDVLRAKRLFRFSGHEGGESKADQFERAFASSVGAAHALAVTSGTAALISGLAGDRNRAGGRGDFAGLHVDGLGYGSHWRSGGFRSLPKSMNH